MLRFGEHPVGGAVLDDPSVLHHDHVVGDLPDDGQVVRDEQVADAQLGLEAREQLEHLGLDADVERGDGLVEDDQLGLERQRAGDRDALPLPARQLGGAAGQGAGGQGHVVEELGRAGPAPRTVPDAERAQRLRDDPLDGQARVEGRVGVLVDELNPTA